MSTGTTEEILRLTGQTPTATSTDEDVKPPADDEKDNTLLYAGVGGAFVIILAIILAKR